MNKLRTLTIILLAFLLSSCFEIRWGETSSIEVPEWLYGTWVDTKTGTYRYDEDLTIRISSDSILKITNNSEQDLLSSYIFNNGRDDVNLDRREYTLYSTSYSDGIRFRVEDNMLYYYPSSSSNDYILLSLST